MQWHTQPLSCADSKPLQNLKQMTFSIYKCYSLKQMGFLKKIS